MRSIFLVGFLALGFAVMSSAVFAQHVDHHDHVIRDSHGHVIGIQHHDVLHTPSHHASWDHHIPSLPTFAGQYYVENGNRYYLPAPQGGTQVMAKPVLVEFGSYARYQDLSGRLEILANEMLLDLHHNYQHNIGFEETYREAYQILDMAKFIHAADHTRDGAAMRDMLIKLDPLFHHVQNDVKGWSRVHHRQVGNLGIVTKMEMVDSVLHHLMNDVGVSEKDLAQSPSPSTQPSGVEQAPPPTLK